MKIAVSFDTLQKRIDWKNYVSMILEEIINNKVDVFDIRIKELPVGYDFHLDIDSSENHYIVKPNTKTIYWCFDAWANYTEDKFLRQEFYIERCKKADYVLSASSATQKNLARYDVKSEVLLPGYIDFSLKSQKRDIDIAYIGNTWWFDGSINGSLNKTKYYIDLINKGFGNKYKVLIGSGYTLPEVYDIYNRSKIVFNHTTCGANHLSNRVFEALYCGAFLITNYVEDLDLLELVEAEDYISYDSEEYLLGIVEEILKDNDALETISNNGHKKILNKFSTENSLNRILQVAKES